MKKRTGLIILAAALLVSPFGPFPLTKDEDPNGMWAGQLYTSDCGVPAGCVTISLKRPGTESRVQTFSAPLRHLKGFPKEIADTGMTSVHFELRRPAGVASFEGQLRDDLVKGQFVFIPDEKYRDAADRLGFGEGEALEFLPLFAANVSRPALAGYSELGYDLTLEDVGQLADAHVDPELIAELKTLGYDRPATETLVSLAKQGFDFDGLQYAFRENDYRPRLEDLVTPLPESAPATTVEALQSMGDPALQQASLTIDEDLVTRFQQALESIGVYPDEDGVRLMEARGLTPDRIQEYAQAGLRSGSLEDLLALQINKIEPRYVKAMLEAGVPDLSDAHGVLAAKAAGLEPHYVADMMASGLVDVRLEDLAQARRVGVGPLFVKQIADAGITNLSLREVILAETLGLDGDFVRDLRQSGGQWATSLDLATLLRARHLGVESEVVRQYVGAGLQEATFEEIISLHMAGVAPKFVRRYLDSHADEREVSSIIRAWIQREHR